MLWPHPRWCVFFKLLSSASFADVDPKAIEAAADEAIGPVANVEFKQLLEKLGGTRGNRVFSFFGIDPPSREAKVMLAEAEAKEKNQQKAGGGAGATIVLDKKNRRGKTAGASAAKRSRLLESILGPDPLQSKGDSEDDIGEEEYREESRPHQAPVAAAPIAARRAPMLEYSAMAVDSDEDKGRATSPN